MLAAPGFAAARVLLRVPRRSGDHHDGVDDRGPGALHSSAALLDARPARAVLEDPRCVAPDRRTMENSPDCKRTSSGGPPRTRPGTPTVRFINRAEPCAYTQPARSRRDSRRVRPVQYSEASACTTGSNPAPSSSRSCPVSTLSLGGDSASMSCGCVTLRLDVIHDPTPATSGRADRLYLQCSETLITFWPLEIPSPEAFRATVSPARTDTVEDVLEPPDGIELFPLAASKVAEPFL